MKQWYALYALQCYYIKPSRHISASQRLAGLIAFDIRKIIYKSFVSSNFNSIVPVNVLFKHRAGIQCKCLR